MPSKSMPQKRKPDITERYKAGTYKPMHIRDIVTKNWFFWTYASVLECKQDK